MARWSWVVLNPGLARTSITPYWPTRSKISGPSVGRSGNVAPARLFNVPKRTMPDRVNVWGDRSAGRGPADRCESGTSLPWRRR